VTKNQLVINIARATKLQRSEIKMIVQMVLDGIIDVLVTEKRMEFRNFGVFEVRRRKARKARNPRTGEEVMIPERNVVTFRPGRRMHRRVLKASGGQDIDSVQGAAAPRTPRPDTAMNQPR
jgi:nucleoid DNA-binding protein